jgi:hypothetical protein
VKESTLDKIVSKLDLGKWEIKENPNRKKSDTKYAMWFNYNNPPNYKYVVIHIDYDNLSREVNLLYHRYVIVNNGQSFSTRTPFTNTYVIRNPKLLKKLLNELVVYNSLELLSEW